MVQVRLVSAQCMLALSPAQVQPGMTTTPSLRHAQLRLLQRALPARDSVPRWYDFAMYAQKFQVDVLIRGERKPCPLEWLDQFCMRNFTNSPDFDDTLPVADGRMEASFRLTPERFAEGLGAWLNAARQRRRPAGGGGSHSRVSGDVAATFRRNSCE